MFTQSKFKNPLKFKEDYLFNYEMDCPSCGQKMIFNNGIFEHGIYVNCYTKGIIKIPGMFHITQSCQNPCCKWSKLKIEKHNLMD